ncbi:MAG: hypothetical protein BroJett011_77300 [Chloroflexota bacterium]|nr:MAG: hypothetical protein BroJett011_77300 [Chloroflexota bacterium]
MSIPAKVRIAGLTPLWSLGILSTGIVSSYAGMPFGLVSPGGFCFWDLVAFELIVNKYMKRKRITNDRYNA